MSTLIEKPDDFARENRRFSTLLFEPSPNQFMVKTIQDLWDQVWQHSTTLVYAFFGDDRLTGSIEENRRLLAGVKAKDLPMIGQRLRRSHSSHARCVAFNAMGLA